MVFPVVCVYLLFQYTLNLLDHFTLSQLQAPFSLLFHRMVIAGLDMSPILFGKIVHFVRIVQTISLFITNCFKKGKLSLIFFRCMCFTCFVMLMNLLIFFLYCYIRKYFGFWRKTIFLFLKRLWLHSFFLCPIINWSPGHLKYIFFTAPLYCAICQILRGSQDFFFLLSSWCITMNLLESKVNKTLTKREDYNKVFFIFNKKYMFYGPFFLHAPILKFNYPSFMHLNFLLPLLLCGWENQKP